MLLHLIGQCSCRMMYWLSTIPRRLPRVEAHLVMPEHVTISRSIFAQTIGLSVSLALCFTAAGLGGLATSQGLDSWYGTLHKPDWNPPNWIFAPVWTTLYCMMGIAAWLVWRSGSWSQVRSAVILFAIQLGLNSLWSLLFFGLQNPGAAFLEIVLLWAAISVTTFLFWRNSALAAMLMMPYLLWVSFASFLNYTIWTLNPV